MKQRKTTQKGSGGDGKVGNRLVEKAGNGKINKLKKIKENNAAFGSGLSSPSSSTRQVHSHVVFLGKSASLYLRGYELVTRS